MGLEAKTQEEITLESCNYSCRLFPPYRGYPKPNFEQKWVRLEDAQKEIDDLLISHSKTNERLEQARQHCENRPRPYGSVNPTNKEAEWLFWFEKLLVVLGGKEKEA